MNPRPHLALDGYKTGHKFQYPEGTTQVYSNFTPRSDGHAKMSSLWDKKVVVYGIQGFILEYLFEEWNYFFFRKEKSTVVRQYKRRMDNYLGPDAVDVQHIADLHDLGYLPLLIKAVPEGERVNIGVPVMTIVNTLPQFYWLTNYIETVLSDELWKPITVATIAYEYNRLIKHYAELTGAPVDFANFQAHDFSMRGMSGREDAAKSGAAHLAVGNLGTDTLPAIDYLEDYYGADSDKELVGCSVPATEHSVMCMGGKDDEVETFRRLITKLYPSGIVSIVSDTWDFWNVITNTASTLKDEILNRQPNALGMAKVVFRPDSGDPVKIITGLTYAEISDMHDFADCDTAAGIYMYKFETKYEVVKYQGKFYTYNVETDGDEYGNTWNERIELKEEVPEHVVKGAVECLWDVFGGDKNEKGYRTLNQRVGLIYGDSITLERAEKILKRLMDKGFTSANIVFGVGSYTYQYITRDTFGMAVKATYGVVDGEGRELFKDPKTDNGTKKSAKGLLRVEKLDGNYALFDQQTAEQEKQGALQTVFYNGSLCNPTTLQQIRNRLK